MRFARLVYTEILLLILNFRKRGIYFKTAARVFPDNLRLEDAGTVLLSWRFVPRPAGAAKGTDRRDCFAVSQ